VAPQTKGCAKPSRIRISPTSFPLTRRWAHERPKSQDCVPSVPALQAQATRSSVGTRLEIRARSLADALSARSRSLSQSARSPRFGVSKPTRRYVAPDRTVSPSTTASSWARAKRVSVPPKEAIRGLLGAADATFAAFTGARASEQWAARWRHVDFTARELTIETRVDAYGDEDVTKSEAGMRTVPLSGALVAELRSWKLRSPHSKDDDLIFPNSRGGHVSHTNFLKRNWVPLFKAAGLPRFKWQHLRHFAASCSIEQKLQPKTVQTFIGHASLAMTMDLYGHLFKSDDHLQAMDSIAADLIG
jgi:integrase